ncbi:unnamed protein product [Calypogeia fissa]
MTSTEDSAKSSLWSDSRRRYFQNRYLFSLILAAVLPFLLLRLFLLFEIVFPLQSVAVNSHIGLQSEEIVSDGHSPISLASAPGREDVMSKTDIPESSPAVRPDEDAWITHDSWINHDFNRTEDGKFIPDEFENSTEFRKDFSLVSANGEDFGLPEDNVKEKVQFETMETTKIGDNKSEESTTAAEELRPQDERTEEEITKHQESKDEEMVNNEGEKQSKVIEETSQQEKSHEDRTVKQEEEKQVEVNGETTQGVEQVEKEEDRPQHESSPTHEETPAEECDLFEGLWEHDPEGPLYTNSTCFYMEGHQNCLSNGRPDTEYLHWRWQPRGCDLPRFDAKSFLEKFRGKAIGFVGDSIARNQMQSLLCLLSQVEIPIKTYQSSGEKSVRWLYKEHQVTLGVVWSPFLLKESEEGDFGFEKGRIILYLDVLDTAWTSVIHDFDVIVFLTGQWFYKRTLYVKQEKVIGCHYCPGLNLTDISYYDVYREAIRLVLDKVSKEYKGLTIMSTFPLSHYFKASWDSGGNCQREQPLEALESKQFPGDHNNMRNIVVEEFNGVVEKNRELKKDTRFELLDVTKVSLQRADGHPGPYRRPHPFVGYDPNVSYPDDCLHWCLPGAIDTWNEIVVKIVDKYL